MKDKLPKLYSFTVPELDRFERLCNFTDDEMIYFKLKSKNITDDLIAEQLNCSISQVGKLSKRVRSKMIRVI